VSSRQNGSEISDTGFWKSIPEGYAGSGALPHGSKLILVVRDGKAEVPDDTMQLEEGDSVLAILEPGKEDEFRRVLVRD